jgi:glutamate synthase domain-containing protein 1
MRRHGLPPEIAAAVFASPLWDEMDEMSEDEKQIYRAIRQTYGSILLNGPFTVIIARAGEMLGLGDRVRLRPLAAAVNEDILYVSSELSTISLVDPEVKDSWTPLGGEPIVGRLGQKPRVPRAHRAGERLEKEEALHV